MKKIKYRLLLLQVIFLFAGCAMISETFQDTWERDNPSIFWSTIPKPSEFGEHIIQNGSGSIKKVSISINRGNPYCRVSLYRKEKGSDDETRIVEVGNVVYINNPAGYYIVDPEAIVGKTYIYTATCTIPTNGQSAHPTREGPRSDPIEITIQ